MAWWDLSSTTNRSLGGHIYTVKAENKVPLSVVTSHANLVIDEESDLQNQCALKPTSWLFQNTQSLVEKAKLLIHEFDNEFRNSRDSLINKQLPHILNEIQGLGENIDDINGFVVDSKRATEEKVCDQCGAIGPISKRKCPNCKGDFLRIDIDINSYHRKHEPHNPVEHFYSEPQENNIKVVVGEPDFCNPNSYDAVSTVLRNLGKRAGIKRYGGVKREWLFVECDGTIFLLIRSLMTNTLLCTKCDTSFYGAEAFHSRDHACEDPEAQHEFDWIILVPGSLHIEMNTSKAFMRLN